jgi:uridine phosphorylase
VTDHFASDWRDSHGDDAAVIEPHEYIREQARAEGITDEPPFPELALVAFTPEFVKPLIELTGAEPCGWHRPSSIGSVNGEPVVVTMIGAGASRSVSLAEPLFGGGVKTMLALGATGSLQPGVRIGDYVVPTSAIREEGTSFHYMPPEYQATAGNRATRALIAAAEQTGRPVHAGRLWTTDAPYREFAGKVRAYAERGVLGVDMETSALMALADFRKAEIGLLLTVSDHVFDNDWPNIFKSDEFTANLAETARVMVAAAGELLGG